jgi:hypothetical protein
MRTRVLKRHLRSGISVGRGLGLLLLHGRRGRLVVVDGLRVAALELAGVGGVEFSHIEIAPSAPSKRGRFPPPS